MVIKSKVSTLEAFYVGIVASTIFAILDILSPTYTQSAQQGIGLATGFKLMRFPY